MLSVTRPLPVNKIYAMDCLNEMKLIEENSTDIVVTSPPYNIGKKYNRLPSRLVYEQVFAKLASLISLLATSYFDRASEGEQI